MRKIRYKEHAKYGKHYRMRYKRYKYQETQRDRD